MKTSRKEKTLTVADFEKMFGEKLDRRVKKKIREYNLKYSEISQEERDRNILKIVLTLLDDSLPYSGAHRHKQWEKGWKQNFLEYAKTKDDNSLLPKYFGKYDIVRISHEFVKTASPDFEPKILNIIIYWLAYKYLTTEKHLFEFGCGPGHNLLKLREINPKIPIWGLDWVSSTKAAIGQIAKRHGDNRLFGRQFNYFDPDYSFKLPPESGILTLASLEQTGNHYKKFIEYLLKNKPSVCVHIEPIAELLDPKILLDCLSIEYFKKRKYLNGLFDYLKILESEGKIKIIEAKRTNAGSLFVDGHSVIVWKPVK